MDRSPPPNSGNAARTWIEPREVGETYRKHQEARKKTSGKHLTDLSDVAARAEEAGP